MKELENFELYGNRVLIELVQDESSSGVVLTAEPVKHLGIIKSVSPDCKDVRTKVGVKVYVNEYGHQPVTIKGKTYQMIGEEMIYGIYKDV